jgi:hypothetical protein
MSDDSFVQLSGSQRGPLADVEPAGAIDGSERIELTIVTRRRAELPLDDAGVPVRLTRRELQHSYGADPADLELVADTLSGLGLEVTDRDAGVVSGEAAPGFQDITSGSNGAYSAGPGWDACSGLGSPDGTALLTELTSVTGEAAAAAL